MYEFWFDYIKPKYNEKLKLCYVGIDSFIVHVNTDDIYEGIVKDVEDRFDNSIYELETPLLKGKIKKVIGLMKDK